jgi:hypothetical protein
MIKQGGGTLQIWRPSDLVYKEVTEEWTGQLETKLSNDDAAATAAVAADATIGGGTA